jgi:phosphoribosylformylglycinamidine synthase
MKARVYVTFKPSVLDPQGQTIKAALNGLGHREVLDVRQGKFFEVTLADGEGSAEGLEAISRDVLSNPVIEDYRIEIIG